jgi:hypothetical protein
MLRVRLSWLGLSAGQWYGGMTTATIAKHPPFVQLGRNRTTFKHRWLAMPGTFLGLMQKMNLLDSVS